MLAWFYSILVVITSDITLNYLLLKYCMMLIYVHNILLDQAPLNAFYLHIANGISTDGLLARRILDIMFRACMIALKLQYLPIQIAAGLGSLPTATVVEYRTRFRGKRKISGFS